MKRFTASLALSTVVGCQPAPSKPPVARPEAPSVSSPTAAGPTAPASPPTCDPTLPERKAPTPPALPADVPVTIGPSADLAHLPNRGAIEAGRGAVNAKVFSGSVFARGNVPLGAKVARLIVPETAAVAFGAPAATVELFVEKTLAFAGHPPQPMPAAGLERNMGMATRIEGSDLVLATYGEWDSRIEGSASILLFVRVPVGSTVVRRVGLEGDDSAAAIWPDSIPYEKQEAGRIGYWYAPVRPSPGWTSVPLRADPQRIARAGPPHPESSHWRREPPPSQELDTAVVRAAVTCVITQQRQATLDTCRRTDPRTAGWFEAAWEVREDGTTTLPRSYVGSIKDTPLAECIRNAIRTWPFPKRARGAYFERFEVAPTDEK